MLFPVELSPLVLALAEELNVRPEDVLEEFVRGSGKGGQKINKTSSTVHLHHLPTNIEVRMQKHREQSKNRLSAWKLLILKIEEQKKAKKSLLAKASFKIRKQKKRRSRKAKEKILQEKHHRSEIKGGRKSL